MSVRAGTVLIVNKTSLLAVRVSFISAVSFMFRFAMMHAAFAALEPLVRHYKTRLYPVWLVRLSVPKYKKRDLTNIVLS